MKAHKDPTALMYSFNQIIKSNRSQPDLYYLREKCLGPGKYSMHLKRWLKLFDPHDLYLIDGDLFARAPYVYLNNLQKYLHIKESHRLEYKNILRYNRNKKFFCYLQKNGRDKCLGASKGRRYEKIDEESKKILSEYYSAWNRKLRELLRFYNYRVPKWLGNQFNKTSSHV
jgi:hypothetical protein